MKFTYKLNNDSIDLFSNEFSASIVSCDVVIKFHIYKNLIFKFSWKIENFDNEILM